MPYTKEQLVDNPYFQDILSANRRAFDEQVEKEFTAMKVSGSSANSTPTLRNSDNSVVLFEDPDFGGGLNRPLGGVGMAGGIGGARAPVRPLGYKGGKSVKK